MKALVPAFAVSIALHAAVYAALPRGGLETRAAPAVRLPASVDVEISVAGGVAPEAARRVGHPLHRKRGRSTPSAIAIANTTAIATSISTPIAIATSTSTPTSTPTPIATADPGGILTPPSDLDLTAFFDRLERAAQRCAGPRSGEGRVRFCVGADGAPTDVALVQSTGNFALDDAALRCVIPGAAPFPRTSRCLVVPLAFH